MGAPGEPNLISRAQAGDKIAFEALLGPLVAPAARLAFAMLQDCTEAEDVVQDAAVKACRRLRNIRPGANFKRGSWPSWLTLPNGTSDVVLVCAAFGTRATRDVRTVACIVRCGSLLWLSFWLS
jgi:hypothetical protein